MLCDLPTPSTWPASRLQITTAINQSTNQSIHRMNRFGTLTFLPCALRQCIVHISVRCKSNIPTHSSVSSITLKANNFPLSLLGELLLTPPSPPPLYPCLPGKYWYMYLGLVKSRQQLVNTPNWYFLSILVWGRLEPTACVVWTSSVSKWSTSPRKRNV